MIQRECVLLCTSLVIQVSTLGSKEWEDVRGRGTLASFTDEQRSRTQFAPFTALLSLSSVHFTSPKYSKACRGSFGYSHIVMKMTL